jgi:hypothetical protein
MQGSREPQVAFISVFGYPKILGHRARKSKAAASRRWSSSARCYTCHRMFAQKLRVDVVIGGEKIPAPLDWLDSFCMRNFTGSAEFDDTLPTSEGKLEAGLNVERGRLAAALGEWLTKRGKGNGKPVIVEITTAS